MERSPILLGLCLLVAACAAVPRGTGAPDFRSLFDPGNQPRVPEHLTWSPDGTRLVYLWDDGDGEALWLLDTADGESRVLVTAGDELPSPSRVRWLADGSTVLVHTGSGLVLVDAVDGALRPLVSSSGSDEDPKLSPDGRRVALVRNGDLHVLDLASGRLRALTDDGDDDAIRNGKTDWVYWEEIWGRDSTGHWWSPDSTRLAYYRFDDRHVDQYPLVDSTQLYPEVTWQRYPKAGRENPAVQVGVIDADGGSTVFMDTGDRRENYLARVHWMPDGGDLVIERLNREQTRLELLRCDPRSGACRILWSEEHPTWVSVDDFTRFLSDGSFIWGSEESGWTHLYLHDANGKRLRRLTPDGRCVTALRAVNEEEGWLVYTSFSTDVLGAKDRRIERLPLAGGEPEILTAQEATHTAVVAESSGNWVHGQSDAETPQRLTVRSADGEELAPLPHHDPQPEARADLPAWRFLTVPGPGGSSLPARLLEPAERTPGRRYPVIVYHYGGPESQVVVNRWDSRNRDLWHKWMAARGYGVFMLDNGQSVYFGRAGEDRGHRQLGAVNYPAQLAAVDYLKGLDWVDGERIGLWGWSGGGANTLYCILHSPGTWAAAVAGAPVTDWHFYDTIWTERYMDHPEDNPDGYRNSSPITHAAELADPLLIVHGTADDNVHPQHTLVFIKKLVDAGIPFEDAIYPRQKHGFGKGELNHFLERMTAFFDRHLGE